MTLTRPNVQYRYNIYKNYFEKTNPEHKPFKTFTPNGNVKLQWIPVAYDLVPEYVHERVNELMFRRNNPRKNPERNKPLYWIELNISLDQIKKVITQFLNLKENQALDTISQRLELISYIMECYFAQLKNAVGDMKINQNDCIPLVDYIDDYSSRYLYKDWSDKFKQIIDLCADYVLAVIIDKKYRREDRAQERFEKKHQSVEDMLKDVPEDDEDFSIDDYIKIKDDISQEISKSYKIYSKRSKKHPDRPVWADVNELKVTYEDLTDEQKALHDEMERLYDLAKQMPRGSSKQKLLNTTANGIKQVLKQQTTYEVGRSGSNKKVDSNLIELTNQKIFEHIDYTNQVHILALINHYYILWETYRNQPGSEMYILLKEFKDNIEKVKLARPEHYEILNAWLYHGSDAKKNAEYLRMDTEKMNRTLKTSISKKVSEYFQKMSGF